MKSRPGTSNEQSHELSFLQRGRFASTDDPQLLNPVGSVAGDHRVTSAVPAGFTHSNSHKLAMEMKAKSTRLPTEQPPAQEPSDLEGSQNPSGTAKSELKSPLLTNRPTSAPQDFMKLRWQYIKRFIDKIKIYSSSVKFALCNKNQLEIINDLSFSFNTFFHQDSSVMKMVNIDADTSFLITPNSVPSRIWDTIQFVFLLIYIIYLPIRLAFDSLYDEPHYFYLFEVVPNVLQIINMFLEFNTGFYNHGLVIRDRKQIFFNYVKKKFIYDFGLNICWIISLKDDSEWLKVVGMLRVVVFVYLISEMEETFSIREIFGSYFDLFKLGGFIFLSAHFVGCCWYALAQYEEAIGVPITWLSKDIANFDLTTTENHAVRGYIASFYWSIVTMCTVGYGDIGPVTYIERIFVIATVLISSFIFGFSMNQIGEILSNLRQSNEEFKAKMTQLSLYMKKRKLNKMMQSRVTRYYQYLYLEDQENNQVGRGLIDDLPPFLRDEVKKDISKQMLKDKDLIMKNFSPQLCSKIYQIMNELKYGAGEFLFKAGSKPDKLYLILKGEVSMTLQDRVSIKTYTEGQFIGAMEFFSDKKYDLSAKTTQFAQIAIIDKEDFMNLVHSRYEDIESFAQVRDSVLLYKNTSMLGQQCESCGKYGHMFMDCHLIKFHSNKQKQIYQYNAAKQITRNHINRMTTKSRTLCNLSLIQKTIHGFADYDSGDETGGIPQILLEGEELDRIQEESTVHIVEKESSITESNHLPLQPKHRLVFISKDVPPSWKVNQRHSRLPPRNNSLNPIDLVQSGSLKTPRQSRLLTVVGSSVGVGVGAGVAGTDQERSLGDSIQSNGEFQEQLEMYREKTIEGLDKMKEFTRYFKHNNYTNTIEHANIMNKRNQMYKYLINRARIQAKTQGHYDRKGTYHARKKAIQVRFFQRKEGDNNEEVIIK